MSANEFDRRICVIYVLSWKDIFISSFPESHIYVRKSISLSNVQYEQKTDYW